jgi:hypothetical protein
MMTIQFVYSQAVSTALEKYAADLAATRRRYDEFDGFASHDVRVPKLPEIYEDMLFLKELNSEREDGLMRNGLTMHSLKERQLCKGRLQHRTQICILPCIVDQPLQESQCLVSGNEAVLPDVFTSKTKQGPSCKTRGK